MPEANPLDAAYFANQAALQFQKETTLAQDKRGREQTNANFNYTRGQLTRQEPLALQSNRNTANSQGLLESGQLAQRQGQTQTKYATQQNRNSEQRRQAIERYNESDQNANRGYLVGTQKAEAESFQRSKEQLERNPPAAQQSYPIPPAQQQAINNGAQPGPGGVVPYESKKVRVGMPLRRAAAQKAVG